MRLSISSQCIGIAHGISGKWRWWRLTTNDMQHTLPYSIQYYIYMLTCSPHSVAMYNERIYYIISHSFSFFLRVLCFVFRSTIATILSFVWFHSSQFASSFTPNSIVDLNFSGLVLWKKVMQHVKLFVVLSFFFSYLPSSVRLRSSSDRNYLQQFDELTLAVLFFWTLLYDTRSNNNWNVCLIWVSI